MKFKHKLNRCPLCDAHYYEDDAEEVRIHDHPEPQSGPFREAHIRSRLSYSEWINKTSEGREWAEQRKTIAK